MACTFPVAGYSNVNHVIHWRVQFSFVLGSFSIFFAFLRRFSSLGAVFVSVLVDFARFFFVFLSVSSKVCLQTCLAICSTASRLRWIRTVLLRLRVVNPPPRLHQFPHHGPPLLRNYRRALRSPSKRRVCHRPFPKLFSSRSL